MGWALGSRIPGVVDLGFTPKALQTGCPGLQGGVLSTLPTLAPRAARLPR